MIKCIFCGNNQTGGGFGCGTNVEDYQQLCREYVKATIFNQFEGGQRNREAVHLLVSE